MSMSYSEYILCFRGYVKKAIKTIWEPIRWNGFFIAKANGYTGNDITAFWRLATDEKDDVMDNDGMLEAWNIAKRRHDDGVSDKDNG